VQNLIIFFGVAFDALHQCFSCYILVMMIMMVMKMLVVVFTIPSLLSFSSSSSFYFIIKGIVQNGLISEKEKPHVTYTLIFSVFMFIFGK
jgi:hypothetical protein